MYLLQPTRKVQGRHYSALAVFKNTQEAEDAYEKVEGIQLKVHI